MKVHFICLGNVFRSRIAEAYLNSLELTGLEVSSGGTVARRDYDINKGIFVAVNNLLSSHKILQFAKDRYGDQTTQELINASDLVICMDQIVRDECSIFNMPQNTLVWGVDDIDEETHVLVSNNGQHNYLEDAYQEIIKNVEELKALIALIA